MSIVQARPRCPRCASPLHRRHRNGFEKLISCFSQRRPYYCKQNHCLWQGWKPFSDEDHPALEVSFMPPAEMVEEGKWRRLNRSALHCLPYRNDPHALPPSHS